MSRTKNAVALLFAMSLSAPSLGANKEAAQKPAPPEGWEEPAPLVKPAEPPKNAKKPASPSCCKFDSTCCFRQTTIETLKPLQVFQVFSPTLDELPEATLKEAKKDEPPFTGVPNPKVTDDGGRPFPWPDEPAGYLIHVVPPGRYGYIKLVNEWFSGYFEQNEYRGMGAGEIRTINEKVKDRGKSLLYVPIEFMSFAQSEPETITFDEVKGKLEGDPEVKATYWMHAKCKNVASGIIFGCNTPFEGEKRATFVLPEVLLGFDSKDAKHVGGFFRSRFSNTVPLTIYYLPIGPGRSGLINATLAKFQINRWFPLPKQKEKLPDDFMVVLSTSQTSVEPTSQIRIFYMKP